jgi:hypothetical protein
MMTWLGGDKPPPPPPARAAPHTPPAHRGCDIARNRGQILTPAPG